HRLREAIDVRDPDLRSRARGRDLLAVRGKRLLRVRLLRLDPLQLRALGLDQHEITGRADDQRAEHGQDDLHNRIQGLSLFHVDGLPLAVRMSATIWNDTTSWLPTFVSVDDTSVTFWRSGITCSRDSKRATPSCEYVFPAITNSVG